MKKCNNLNDIPRDIQYDMTIGSFDGVHNGHKHILNKIKSNCKKRKRLLVVVTFKPHPLINLLNNELFLINSYKERDRLLFLEGVDIIVSMKFDRAFSMQSPKCFVDKCILGNKGLGRIYVGHDFYFGKNKEGDYSFLKQYCQDSNVEVSLLDKYEKSSQRISSTLIRSWIKDGDIEKSNEALGRMFSLSGVVKRGDGRGKTLGFPTANLDISKSLIRPCPGVYITKVSYNREVFTGITNVGFRPTFGEGEDIYVEAHVFNFNEEIYGKSIELFFYKYIRKEKKFDSREKLVEQIKKDCKYAADYFSNIKV